jgi:hypothetical protein
MTFYGCALGCSRLIYKKRQYLLKIFGMLNFAKINTCETLNNSYKNIGVRLVV